MPDPLEIPPLRLLAVAELILMQREMPADPGAAMEKLDEMRESALERSDFENAAKLKAAYEAILTKRQRLELLKQATTREHKAAWAFLLRCGFFEAPKAEKIR